MSDRIDELVEWYHDALAMFTEATDKCTSDDPPWSLIHDLADVSEQAITELATIAREAEAERDEWRQKYAEADERAWACESVGIPGMETRALKAEARIRYLEADNKAMWQVVFYAEQSVDNGCASMELEDAVEAYLQQSRAASEAVARSDHTYG